MKTKRAPKMVANFEWNTFCKLSKEAQVKTSGQSENGNEIAASQNSQKTHMENKVISRTPLDGLCFVITKKGIRYFESNAPDVSECVPEWQVSAALPPLVCQESET